MKRLFISTIPVTYQYSILQLGGLSQVPRQFFGDTSNIPVYSSLPCFHPFVKAQGKPASGLTLLVLLLLILAGLGLV